MKTLQLFILIMLISAAKVLAQQNDTIIIFDPVTPPSFGKPDFMESKFLNDEARSFNVAIVRRVTPIIFDAKNLVPGINPLSKTASLILPITLPVKFGEIKISGTENKKDN